MIIPIQSSLYGTKLHIYCTDMRMTVLPRDGGTQVTPKTSNSWYD